MKRLTLILLMVSVPLYSTLAQDRGGGQGTPIYLDVSVQIPAFIVASYNPPPNDLSQVVELQCVISAMVINQWGMLGNINGQRNADGSITVLMLWQHFLLGGNPDIIATQQSLAACEYRIDIKANLSGVIMP